MIPAINTTFPVFNLPSTSGLTPAEASPLPDASSVSGAAPAQGGGSEFSNLLSNMVSEVNDKQISASQTVNAMQSGQNVSLHQAVIAMEEANVSFQLMVEVRNKLLDSYQELMRMQV
jgi:flagellar hook-basal body complex protein FliE